VFMFVNIIHCTEPLLIRGVPPAGARRKYLPGGAC
jgi:hypothetical protein